MPARLVLTVSPAVTALRFQPKLWVAFFVGNLLAGITHAMPGAPAGAALAGLGETHLVSFAAVLALGTVQNPMLGTARHRTGGVPLPGYYPSLGWAVLLVAGVVMVLTRAGPDGGSGVLEGDHHAGFGVVDVVTVDHPVAGVVSVQVDREGLHRSHQHGVLAQS